MADGKDEGTPGLVVLDHVLTLIVAGGVFLTLVSGTIVPTAGGRRSARLKWELRNQAIRDAVEAASVLESRER
jgi:hypothetical protein